MRIPLPDSSFSDDDRGVAPLIGFIILFGFVVIALTTYQAQVVPQQNSEVEFQHFQEARNDMVGVRSAVSTAGQADVSQYPTVTLGTNYQARTFTLNPPPPSGTLETSPAYNISIRNESGEPPENVSTRFLKYQNGYNEIDIGPMWYENSVLYLDERNTGGEVVIYEDQNIVTENNTTARVTALQNNFRVSSTGRVTLELYPTENASTDLSDFEGNVTIKFPSRLDGSTYWNNTDINTTGSNKVWYHGTEPTGESGIYRVILTVKADALKINTVGIQDEPGSQTAKQGVGFSAESSIETESQANSVQAVDGSAKNPGGPGGQGKLKFEITTTDPVELDAAGIETTGNLSNVGAEAGSKFKIFDGMDKKESIGAQSTNGNFDYVFNPNVSVNPDDGEVEVEFDELDSGIDNFKITEDKNKADIIISLRFDDGSTIEYYFEEKKEQNGGGGDPPDVPPGLN